MSKLKIILADDEKMIINMLREVAENQGFEVYTAENGKQVIELVSREQPDALLLDVVMPDMEGTEVIRELTKMKSKTSIILMSGYKELYLDAAGIIGTAGGLRILGKLVKPFEVSKLIELLDQVS